MVDLQPKLKRAFPGWTSGIGRNVEKDGTWETFSNQSKGKVKEQTKNNASSKLEDLPEMPLGEYSWREMTEEVRS